jgi:hypothetical protein
LTNGTLEATNFNLNANNLYISSDGYIQTADSSGNKTRISSGRIEFRNSSNESRGQIYTYNDDLWIVAGKSYTDYSRDIQMLAYDVDITCTNFSISGLKGKSGTISIPKTQNYTVVTGGTTATQTVVTGVTQIGSTITTSTTTLSYVKSLTTATIVGIDINNVTNDYFFSKGILYS